MIAFIIWSVMGLFFIGLGVFSFLAKKEMGFWANTEAPSVENIKGYNRAIGKLWCVYGVIFIILGIPLWDVQNSAFILMSVLGVMFESIGAMIVYIMVIENKYRRQR